MPTTGQTRSTCSPYSAFWRASRVMLLPEFLNKGLIGGRRRRYRVRYQRWYLQKRWLRHYDGLSMTLVSATALSSTQSCLASLGIWLIGQSISQRFTSRSFRTSETTVSPKRATIFKKR